MQIIIINYIPIISPNVNQITLNILRNACNRSIYTYACIIIMEHANRKHIAEFIELYGTLFISIF